MAAGDYVNAMKFYSQALTATPKDASLFSLASVCRLLLSRSFSFDSRGPSALRAARVCLTLWCKRPRAGVHPSDSSLPCLPSGSVSALWSRGLTLAC